MVTNKEKLTALIITYNEMGYIEKCLDSVSFADEIIVVDSFSTDGTYEFLKSHPKVKVIQNPFENFTAQKSFALKQATNDWVLFLDADEIVSTSLQMEISETVSNDTEIAAFWFYRQFMFKNEKLNFSDCKIVHETLDVEGTSGILKEKLIHYCYKNHEDYKGKMLKYGRLKAIESFYREKKYSYAMMIAKTSWKFFNHYILRLGFLDGKKGFIICHLNSLGVLERYRELKKLEQKNELAYYLVMP